MNCCRETTKMDVPARHRERPAKAGGPPGNRRELEKTLAPVYRKLMRGASAEEREFQTALLH